MSRDRGGQSVGCCCCVCADTVDGSHLSRRVRTTDECGVCGLRLLEKRLMCIVAAVGAARSLVRRVRAVTQTGEPATPTPASHPRHRCPTDRGGTYQPPRGHANFRGNLSRRLPFVISGRLLLIVRKGTPKRETNSCGIGSSQRLMIKKKT